LQAAGMRVAAQKAVARFVTGLDRSIDMGTTSTIWARVLPESLPCDLNLHQSIYCRFALLVWGLVTDGSIFSILLISHGRAGEPKGALQLADLLDITLK